MHKKYLAFGLPVLGALAVVGSGFSAWAFGGNTTYDDASINVAVTEVAQYGKVTPFSDTVYLLLDQGGQSNASGQDYGISFVKVATSSTDGETITFNKDEPDTFEMVRSLGATYSINQDLVDTLINSGFTKYNLSSEISLTSPLTNYVEFKALTTAQNSDSTYTYSLDNNVFKMVETDSQSLPTSGGISNDAFPSIDVSSTESTSSGSKIYSANKLLQYATVPQEGSSTVVGKPTDSAALSSMSTALTSATITVTFTVTFA